jgi:hypothetical protein
MIARRLATPAAQPFRTFFSAMVVSAFQRHDQRAQRIAVRRDDDLLAAHDGRQDVEDVVGPDAGAGILQRLAAGRRHVIGTAPDLDLLLAPLGARIVLVEAGEVAIVALVQGKVADRRQIGLAELAEDQLQRVLGAGEFGGEGETEGKVERLEALAGGRGLGDTLLGQRGVAPAREQVLQVPLTLAMADEHEKAIHTEGSFWGQSVKPSTSAME